MVHLVKQERNVLEKHLDNETEELLETLGFVFFKTHGAGMQKSGQPDYIAYKDGRLVCIENKNPDGSGTLTALQYVKLMAYVEQGAIGIVSDNIAFTKEFLWGEPRKSAKPVSEGVLIVSNEKYKKQALKGLEACSMTANNG